MKAKVLRVNFVTTKMMISGTGEGCIRKSGLVALCSVQGMCWLHTVAIVFFMLFLQLS